MIERTMKRIYMLDTMPDGIYEMNANNVNIY